MIPTRTLARFIRQQEESQATGELSDLLSSIALGVKIISQMVATAGFRGLNGYTGKTNVQGEETRVLDEEADNVMVELLASSGHFGLLLTEERDTVISTEAQIAKGKYIVALDPLDGSSNLGSNIPVGTIFAIWRKKDLNQAACEGDFLQTGRKLVAAGYSVYGAKTSFVYSTGRGVMDFTLDPTIGEFVLTEENIRCPEKGSTYSVNEGNDGLWSDKLKSFVSMLKTPDKDKGTPFTGRYVGSLVADFDRTMRKGGIFLYPENKKSPNGKLRLLYESVPLAFIMEQAGGDALAGTTPVLDIVPETIHQRAPLVIGSKREMGWYREWMIG